MPGPQGFERFNTTTNGSRRAREPVSASGSPWRSSAAAVTRGRLKLLAVISVAVVIAAYAGPGLASGGDSEGPVRLSDRPEESSGADQYDQESRTDEEPDANTRRTPPETEEDNAPSRPRSDPPPPVPFSSSSSADDISTAGDILASGAAEDDAGAVAPPQRISTPNTSVSYNAEPYCRTFERGTQRRMPARSSTNARAVFPLPEEYFDSYDDTWGAARPQGGHEGTDLMSPTGTPEYAITDGTVVRVSGSNANGWNHLGGYTVMIRADHSIGPVKKGDLFYYAHLDRESPLPIGAEVEAGEQVGVVGDTGYGPEGTRGQFPPHLHLGWYDTTGTTSEAPSGAMNPYPLLEWLKRNGGTASGGWGPEKASAGYCDYQERAAAEPPAADGGGHDHGRASAGSADLDTGSPDPRPSPVVKRVEERTSSSRTDTHSEQQPSSGGRQERSQGDASSTDPEKRDSRTAPGTGSTEPSPSDERAGERVEEREQEVRRDDDSAGEPARSPERDTPEPTSSAPPSGPEPEEPEPPRDASSERDTSEPAGRGSILPVAFHDEDADGHRDDGEPELSGWSVELSRAGSDSFGESGERISRLEPGLYRVTVEAAEGYERTTPGTVSVRVGERGESRPSFGFAEPAEVTVLVCGDSGDDGPCAAEEGSLHRWKVRLLDEKGRLVAEATTGRDGKHRFPDLRPGDYELIFAPPGKSSSGEYEPRTLTAAAGDSRSVELKEEDPSPSAEQYQE